MFGKTDLQTKAAHFAPAENASWNMLRESVKPAAIDARPWTARMVAKLFEAK